MHCYLSNSKPWIHWPTWELILFLFLMLLIAMFPVYIQVVIASTGNKAILVENATMLSLLFLYVHFCF